jgi:hypothetical protein
LWDKLTHFLEEFKTTTMEGTDRSVVLPEAREMGNTVFNNIWNPYSL